MKRLPWLFLLGLSLVACNCPGASQDDSPAPGGSAGLKSSPVLDVAKGQVVLDEAPAQDPRVEVNGPSTVYVLQNGQVRIIIDWLQPGSGEVTLPLRAVDDRSGPLTVRVQPGSTYQFIRPGYTTRCSDCFKEAYKCCM